MLLGSWPWFLLSLEEVVTMLIQPSGKPAFPVSSCRNRLKCLVTRVSDLKLSRPNSFLCPALILCSHHHCWAS